MHATKLLSTICLAAAATTILATPLQTQTPQTLRPRTTLNKSAEDIIKDIHSLKEKTDLLTQNINDLDASGIYGTEGDVSYTIGNIKDDLERDGDKLSGDEIREIGEAMHDATPNIVGSIVALTDKACIVYNKYYLAYTSVKSVVQDLQFVADGAMSSIIKRYASNDDSELVRADQKFIDDEFSKAVKAYSRGWSIHKWDCKM